MQIPGGGGTAHHVGLHEEAPGSLRRQREQGRDVSRSLYCGFVRTELHPHMERLGGSVGRVSNSWPQLRSWSQGREFEPCVGFHAGRGADQGCTPCQYWSCSLKPVPTGWLWLPWGQIPPLAQSLLYPQGRAPASGTLGLIKKYWWPKRNNIPVATSTPSAQILVSNTTL